MRAFGGNGLGECRFYPTCSQYAEECFQRFPFWKAFMLTVKRLLKCHPWNSQEHGVDFPPLEMNLLNKNTEDK